jgi:chromosome partitioning protein
MKTFCIINHKGGVGKTTSVVNIGAGLAIANQRVLLVDIDPQSNLSESFGLIRVKPSIYDSFVNDVAVPIHNVKPNLDVVPASLDLAMVDLEIAGEMSRESLLKDILEPVKHNYDFIIIDSPPSLGLLTINALVAADDVYIPLEAEFLAYRGIDSIVGIIEKVRKKLNKNLKIGGVFMTKFNKQRILTRTIREEVSKYFGDVLLESSIRVNVALAESPANAKDIFEYAPDSKGADDYKDLVLEILNRQKTTK